MYSASVDERDTTCCFLEDQEMAALASRKVYAPIDFLSFLSSAQSESE